MNKKVLIALLVPAVLLASALVIYGIIYRDAQRLPDNNPRSFLAKGRAARQCPVVVCAGDSITHGRVSVDYVDILARRPKLRGYAFVNAGINSELAFNLRLRLDAIIRCDPAVITILIGTNDANASLNDRSAQRAISEMNLPRKPDREWFRENLTALCVKLKARTKARIALLSLPPIGEEPGSDAYRRAAEYSRIIRDVAAEQKVDYLPLNETMSRGIEGRGVAPELRYEGDTEMPLYIVLAKHYLLRKSYDEISEENGLYYLTDLLHLNTRGASAVADLIEEYIHKGNPPTPPEGGFRDQY
ncbi:MAG TPA: SGNH/GDSL hydrolase family protein [Spirochaetota bacterium]|nr:SGNH/GDSL hydrolase family protein [Spirochaetota bacterium]HQF08375.1 SGNH/GDSL hydrolase family protein [Spirochaetota bacterium]HQH99012.1 SGNH/GDSL hydrolase family protein [Spirochaetota bacterium]HQJ73214.1 SGNH/GDSL hydrolase family protein [Spirochaetota bacterium]HRT77590.1 SGNH/GDSL hydrolase family protein [Spirochaetota bacterium]